MRTTKPKASSRDVMLGVTFAIALSGLFIHGVNAVNPVRKHKILTIVDKNGEPRIFLSATDGGPSLEMTDENGDTRVALSVSPLGHPVATLAAKNGGFTIFPTDDGSLQIITRGVDAEQRYLLRTDGTVTRASDGQTPMEATSE